MQRHGVVAVPRERAQFGRVVQSTGAVLAVKANMPVVPVEVPMVVTTLQFGADTHARLGRLAGDGRHDLFQQRLGLCRRVADGLGVFGGHADRALLKLPVEAGHPVSVGDENRPPPIVVTFLPISL